MLNQIGFVAWRNGRREVGIRLVTMAMGMFAGIGAAEQRQVMQNFAVMAGEQGWAVAASPVKARLAIRKD